MKTKRTLIALALLLGFAGAYVAGHRRDSAGIRVQRDRSDISRSNSSASIGYDPYFCRVNDFRFPPLNLPQH